jgi:hypothetical protein
MLWDTIDRRVAIIDHRREICTFWRNLRGASGGSALRSCR